MSLVTLVGRIIPPLHCQSNAKDAGDKTFEFTSAACDQLVMDLPGSPLRLEHHPDMEVGLVKGAWRDSSGVYIAAVIDRTGLTANFARCAVQDQNNAYYTSLSLSHEHLTYPDLSSRKR
ncbi:hypothetical protein OAU26_03665, partial [Mariniblastus sp.]|nr:hypothetical protein [Mariniblastus sp.]